MNRQNTELLRQVHKAASSGLEAIETVLPKVKTPSLKEKIEAQGVSYQKLISRSEAMLRQENAMPEKSPVLQKAVMWGAIQMNTLADASPEHVAELMINGSNMSIVEMTKQLNSAPEADSGARCLAEEYLRGEQRHLDEMKPYLRG